jgi:hypothetical protein
LPNETRVQLAQQYQPLIKNTTKETEWKYTIVFHSSMNWTF